MPTNISMTVPERDILDTKRLEKLLANGLNPSAYCQFGFYPLEVAALRRNVEAVRLLLAAGAKPDVMPEKSRPSNVLACATKGMISPDAMSEICKMLVHHGANPNGNDQKQASPLHQAVKAGNHAAVKILARLGADLEAIAMSQSRPEQEIGTPLQRAAMSFAEPMMLILLRLGANDECLAKSGYTPFQECVRVGFNDVVTYYVDERGENLHQKTVDGKSLLQLAKKEPTKRLLRSMMADAQIPEAFEPPAGMTRYKPSKALFVI
jgi:ankyrin repeat protein